MNDKLSRYNMEVEYNNKILLYNTRTNKLLPVKLEDYAVIETLMDNLSVFNEKYPDLYAAFLTSGFIIREDFDELAYLKLQNKRSVFMNKDYHLTINPTLDCNLKCWHCSVRYAGAEQKGERMNDGTVSSLSRHIELLATRQKANSILLDWFGGEPMMYFDEVIKKVSDSAMQIAQKNELNFRQQITTNATLLNEERIRYMKESNFNFFQISIDGNERRQNLIKYYGDKRGTYRDVIRNINMLTEIIPDASICLRVNYDRQTLKTIQDIIGDFSEQSKRRITVDFQRVWQVSCTEEMRRMLKETKETFKEAGFISRFWAYRPLRFKCCYADSYNHYVINYNGKIFKCTARDYGDNLVLGNLQDTGEIIWNYGILSKMFEKATFENERCENCRMLPLCMGPCIQRNYDARMNNKQLSCIYENVEYSLSSYVIEMANKMI